jgi:hypothetical protein
VRGPRVGPAGRVQGQRKNRLESVTRPAHLGAGLARRCVVAAQLGVMSQAGGCERKMRDLKNEPQDRALAEKAPMGVLFQDGFLDGFGTWPLAYIPYGGPDFAELAAVAKAVGSGDASACYAAWIAAGDRGRSRRRGQPTRPATSRSCT